jgi:hypothetical protein
MRKLRKIVLIPRYNELWLNMHKLGDIRWNIRIGYIIRRKDYTSKRRL